MPAFTAPNESHPDASPHAAHLPAPAPRDAHPQDALSDDDENGATTSSDEGVGSPRGHVVAHHARGVGQFFKRPVENVGRAAKRRLRARVTGDPTGETRVREYVKLPRTIQLIDKLSFTGGVLGLMLTQHVATTRPGLFWLYYLVVAPFVFANRVATYTAMKYHYFLIDFCYYANAVCFAQILVNPGSARLFRTTFAYATGPILWAIPLWRNSLVFHSHDKVQSVFIHTAPAILTYCARWYGQDASPLVAIGAWSERVLGTRLPGLLGGNANRLGVAELSTPMTSTREMLTEFYLWPTLGYIAWQVAYLLKTEVHDVKRLDEDPELVTSLRWLAGDYKLAVTRSTLRTCRWLGFFKVDELFDASSIKTKMVFVTLQLAYTVATFLPIPLCYRYKTFHTALVGLTFLSCIWNGACYYIDIFSRRYIKRFEDGSNGANLRHEDQQDGIIVTEVTGRKNTPPEGDGRRET